ncbi:MAG: DUF2892 domain-containing protein [bacterium]
MSIHTADGNDDLFPASRPRAPRVRTKQHNVARAERIASVAIGTTLIAVGLRRRDGVGLAAALVGGAFAVRGATGSCPVYRALGVSTGDADVVLDAPVRVARLGPVRGASWTDEARTDAGEFVADDHDASTVAGGNTGG